MELFDVFKRYPVEPVRGKGSILWDRDGTRYIDLYGGHAVISIGHCNPRYVQALTRQAARLGFYSNAVANSLQVELARLLGRISGYDDYRLFLCNSGAEANENALKLASFATGRARVLAFSGAFHGRTSGAVSLTDNPAIRSPFNASPNAVFAPLGDIEAVEKLLSDKSFAAVLIEGIQGVAGIHVPDDDFLRALREVCDRTGTKMILDEIQSGYGRTGRFFAHQWAGIRADLVTVAKGMANGLPIGGVLISPAFKASYGMLGTTFGGNHLACAGAIAVLEEIESGHLQDHALRMGEKLRGALEGSSALTQYRGRGLMIGLALRPESVGLRERLLLEKQIFTGASGPGVIRLLPALNVPEAVLDEFLDAWNALI